MSILISISSYGFSDTTTELLNNEEIIKLFSLFVSWVKTNSIFSLADIFESNLIDNNDNLEENSINVGLNIIDKENLSNIKKGKESDGREFQI